MPNGSCQMHGGTNMGAPKDEKNSTYRHGLFTVDAIQTRQKLLKHIGKAKDLLAELLSRSR